MYYFYILKSEDFFKYGITSGDPSIRIKRHCRTYKIDLSESYVVELSKDNYRVLENNIKRTLKEFKYDDGLKPDGHSERIKIEKFEEFVNITSVVLGLHGIKMQKVANKPKIYKPTDSEKIIKKLKRAQEQAFDRLKQYINYGIVYFEENSGNYFVQEYIKSCTDYDYRSLKDKMFSNGIINTLYFKEDNTDLYKRLYLNATTFEHLKETEEIKNMVSEFKYIILDLLEDNERVNVLKNEMPVITYYIPDDVYTPSFSITWENLS